jgi:hypothetical protein
MVNTDKSASSFTRVVAATAARGTQRPGGRRVASFVTISVGGPIPVTAPTTLKSVEHIYIASGPAVPGFRKVVGYYKFTFSAPVVQANITEIQTAIDSGSYANFTTPVAWSGNPNTVVVTNTLNLILIKNNGTTVNVRMRINGIQNEAIVIIPKEPTTLQGVEYNPVSPQPSRTGSGKVNGEIIMTFSAPITNTNIDTVLTSFDNITFNPPPFPISFPTTPTTVVAVETGERNNNSEDLTIYFRIVIDKIQYDNYFIIPQWL